MPPPLAQNEAMSAHEYRGSDDEYRAWLIKNPGGYVINIQRSHNPADARLHDADCTALTGQLDLDVKLTGQYVKVCGNTLTEVEDWAAKHIGDSVPPCERCRDFGGPGGSPRGAGLCPTCRYELSVTGKCPSCDED
jgi:hypothetical protein